MMNNNELKELLTELDSDIDNELNEFFNNNQRLKSKFSKLINIIVWENSSLNDDVINKLDILTDNMDSFNFNDAKNDIDELLRML